MQASVVNIFGLPSRAPSADNQFMPEWSFAPAIEDVEGWRGQRTGSPTHSARKRCSAVSRNGRTHALIAIDRIRIFRQDPKLNSRRRGEKE